MAEAGQKGQRKITPTRTDFWSSHRTVTIGPGRPTVLIGERLNPTGKPWLAEALRRGDFSVLIKEAHRQVAAGADALDVNVGVPGLEEPQVLRAAVEALSAAVEVPLCLDSANPASLAAALSAYQGKALVNSVNGEERSLATILPLVKEYGAAVIGLTMDEGGIPAEAEGRVAIARRIAERAEKTGLPREDVVIDCLAMTVGTDARAAQVTLEALRRITAELGLNTVLGGSNISFGLPGRPSLNAAFLSLAIACGLTCTIADPTTPEVRRAILAADLLAGRDEFAQRYIAYWRAQESPKTL